MLANYFASLLSWLKKDLLLILYFFCWILYFGYFWQSAIRISDTGNVIVGNVNIWGDWAAHFTMGSAMAYRSLLLDTSPFLISAPFSYPFATNLISAILIRAGLPFFTAFVLPSFLFSIACIVALYLFYRVILRSKTAAIIASCIFLFNGGIGFTYFITDILQSPEPMQTILFPPREYTNMEPLFIRWISVINSQIIPQRAFTLGFPIALTALGLLYFLLIRAKQPKLQWPHVVLLVLLMGFLPLVHTHAFLAVFVILGCWMIGDVIQKSKSITKVWMYSKSWLQIGLLTASVAIPLISIFLVTNIKSDFIQWFPGWYAYEYPELNWLEFWWKNWTIVPLLATTGYMITILTTKGSRQKIAQALFFLPYFILFALVNLFLFQPFIWDNTKLLTWVSLGFAALTARVLLFLWHKHAIDSTLVNKSGLESTVYLTTIKMIFSRLIVISLILLITFSGFIDAWRIIRFKVNQFQMYSKEEVELASWVKSSTNSSSVWLTGDQHNNWLYNLTGRQPLLTFRGWLWTHGYNYHQVESDVYTMFSHPSDSYLFERYAIDYILVGDNELNVWSADEQEIMREFRLIKESEHYKIFAVE